MHKDSIVYHSNGKILLTGEYLVLAGARALGLPTRFGQSLTVETNGLNEEIRWETRIRGENWLTAVSEQGRIDGFSTDSPSRFNFLMRILHAASRLSPAFADTLRGKNLIASLDYDIHWGLGSSATLISNIAWLADLDPFDLHFAVSKGSGYDIACARSANPLIYSVANQIPTFEETEYRPPFHDQLFFVYLGAKKPTEQEVKQFGSNLRNIRQEVEWMNRLTGEILNATRIDDFSYLIREHEQLISKVTGKRRISRDYFSDYPYEIKSLGAWGGDFVLFIWQEDPEGLYQYARKKGLTTIYPYQELIKNMYDGKME